jgi:uridylate kinase
MSKKKSEKFIVSLGGSLIVPDEIDTKFLKGFKQVIEKNIKQGKQFLFITGGGRTSRRYSEAAKDLGELNTWDLDWLGIHTTRLNAHLMRTIFRKYARPRIITNPLNKSELKGGGYKILVAAGYKPGFSTDYDAVLLARHFKVKTVLNLSNIEYVYDKDPRKYKSARPIKNLTWKEFRKLVGNKWDPGLNAPFDPIASKLAEKLSLRVVIMQGKNIKNLANYLAEKKFKGTIIE